MPGLESSSFTALHQQNHVPEEMTSGVDKENGTKSAPIFEAVKSGTLASVQTLVEKQGSGVLWACDEKGHTPAHWACLGGHTDVLRFLIENKATIDEASSDEFGMKPIHWASVNGHIAVVDILINAGVFMDTVDNRGFTPLIVACQYGHTTLAVYLMGKGAGLQLTDRDGDTALHWAAFKGHAEVMRLLMYSGVSPRQRDNHGQTPLHLACINGDMATIKELCEQGQVELDLMDNKGRTPLALAMGRKHEKVVDYLKTEAKYRSNFLPRIDLWTIIFGPPGNTKFPLLFFISCVFTWGYPMYIFRCLPETYDDFQALHVFFIMCNVVMWITLYHSNSINPGYLPRNIPEYDLAIRQVAQYDEWKQDNNALKRLCHTCRTIKPMRAKHCRYCNRCVKEFDHHCPYIHNCVGYYNRVSFVIFSFTMAVTGLISMFFASYVLYKENFPFRPDYYIAMCLYIFFEAIAVFVSFTTIYHASMNITTNERVNKKRYDYLKDSDGNFFNPYNKGAKHNFLQFLHLIRSSTLEEDVEFQGVKIM